MVDITNVSCKMSFHPITRELWDLLEFRALGTCLLFIASYSSWLSSTAAIFNHEVENSSCTNLTQVHHLWSRVHELNGTQHHLMCCQLMSRSMGRLLWYTM